LDSVVFFVRALDEDGSIARDVQKSLLCDRYSDLSIVIHCLAKLGSIGIL
jgi:hypothetical protein